MCLRSRRTRNTKGGAFQLAQLANSPLPLPCPFWVVPVSAWVVNTARRAEGRQNVHRGDKPWPPAGPMARTRGGAAGNSKAETNREPVPLRKCLWRRVAGVRYDA